MTRHLIIAFVFLVIAVSAYMEAKGLFAPLVFLFGYIAAVIYERRYEARRERFIKQLKSSRSELRAGGTVVVDGMMLRYNSIVTSFSLSLGFLFVNIVIRSPWVVANKRELRGESFAYSIGSVLLGWWSFPTGPLTTIHCLQENLSGGDVQTVAKLIDARLLELAEQQQQRDRELVDFYHREVARDELHVEKVAEVALAELGPTISERQLTRSVSNRPHYGVATPETRSAKDLHQRKSVAADILKQLKAASDANSSG